MTSVEMKLWLDRLYQGTTQIVWMQTQTVLTPALALITTVVVAFQFVQVVVTPANSLQQIADYYFMYHPWLAWPVSPFVHGSVSHYAANLFFLFVTGAIAEQHLRRIEYVVLTGTAAVVSIAAGAVVLLATANNSSIAYYGLSGVVFAFAGFVLAYNRWFTASRSPADDVGACVGALAGALVGTEVLTATISLTLVSLNGGHTAGFFIGLIFAFLLARLR